MNTADTTKQALSDSSSDNARRPAGEQEQRLLTPEELADIERFQRQRRKSPVAADAWLYVAEIDRLLGHIRLEREQLENEIFQDATDPAFTAPTTSTSDNATRAAEVAQSVVTAGRVVNINAHGEPTRVRLQEIETAVSSGYEREYRKSGWSKTLEFAIRDLHFLLTFFRDDVTAAAAPADNDAESRD